MVNTLVLREKSKQLISLIVKVHQSLKEERDLSPRNNRVNQLLTLFVDQVADVYSREEIIYILQHHAIKSIQSELYQLLGQAETEMEFYYGAAYANRDPLKWDDLKQFIYWKNYVELSCTELQELQRCGWNTSKIAFVGAGPLPLSSFLFQQQTGAPVTCIDLHTEACDISRTLIGKLGQQSHIEVENIAGEEVDYSGYSLVFIASLVPNKQEILKQIHCTNPGAIVAIRTVEGLKQLLYCPVDEKKLIEEGYQIIGRTIANKNIINTTLFLKAKMTSDL
ncbi:nicotianamine synthase family protein [Thermoflavimicrobium dichotomicum]|uniref:Nicotianamine synthase protein n=1 Tax=Thermoflavimicrobium dichotomicum TaxID=46223 RepID=A0A1I3L9R5_9BACL|nr:nicotianamine synthase family protein [Thermoflavimicrobium dichotomicum]SFI81478.1 Nicotianamine synthase protein [Thermoflavimicrobium dichotomicum]